MWPQCVCVCVCREHSVYSRTSAHGHFPAPGSVRSAHAMLGASGEQEPRLARVHEHVAERRHVHPRHGGVRRAARLLARMRCTDVHRCYRNKPHYHGYTTLLLILFLLLHNLGCFSPHKAILIHLNHAGAGVLFRSCKQIAC